MIKLKIPYNKAELLQNALKGYFENFEQYLSIGDLTELDKMYVSTAKELYYKQQSRFSRQFPVKNMTFSWHLHQALTVFVSLNLAQNNYFPTQLEFTQITRTKHELHQLITNL